MVSIVLPLWSNNIFSWEQTITFYVTFPQFFHRKHDRSVQFPRYVQLFMNYYDLRVARWTFIPMGNGLLPQFFISFFPCPCAPVFSPPHPTPAPFPSICQPQVMGDTQGTEWSLQWNGWKWCPTPLQNITLHFLLHKLPPPMTFRGVAKDMGNSHGTNWSQHYAC